ncbi:MAG TPA: DsrE/DsrF/DrsH-like family protein [Candidatus Bathyarchaeia archaeon]|nr:DsrE/DsrF/DrsH-like family protein [Candidatus Bathyarchaeia archaeon]
MKVTLFVGSDEYEKLCCALDAGTVAAAMGAQVTMYFATRGLKAIMKDGTKNIPRLEGGPTVDEQLRRAKEFKVKLYACELATKIYKVEQSDLIAEAKIAGTATFINEAADSDVVLTFI